MPSEEDLIREIEKHAKDLAEAVATARYCHREYVEEINRTLEKQLAASKAEHERTLAILHRNHQSVISSVRESLGEVEEACGFWATPWNDSSWRAYKPDLTASPPALTRVGELSLKGINNDILTTPALLPIIGGRNVLIKAEGAAKSRANAALQSLVLRLLATLPAGKFRLLLVDPVGLGRGVAGFMHLEDYMAELVGGKVWTEPSHIEQQLADLSEYMEMVIQKYLRNRFTTMEDYNLEAGEVSEPYRLLVALNFPVNFSETAARRLVSIASNGPRCGVYVLATMDTEQPLPYSFNLADLDRTATLVAWDGDRGEFVYEDEGFGKATLALDMPPAPTEFERLVRSIGAVAESANTVEVPLGELMPQLADWQKANTCRELKVPIGRVGARGIQFFTLGQGTAQGALIAGRPGSGKSNLLHVLINSLAIHYPPEELDLYLVDFKKGVEFKVYAREQFPHARVIAIESEREFGLSVLDRLDAELSRRGELFRHAGCSDITEFRGKTGQLMPRVLLLVDEFQEFFSHDDTLASQAALLLDRLARQGRAFGIHVLLGSQTLGGAFSLSRTTMDQMSVRIALQCSDADSRLILSDDNAAARLLSRPGEGIYNTAGGLLEGNTPFQVALLTPQEREQHARRLRALAQERLLRIPPPIVFEGNQPAHLDENQALELMLHASDWPERGQSVLAWLGDPVAIRPPTAARFRKRAGSNLIVIGRDEDAAVGMLSAALISLAMHHRPGEARFIVANLVTHDAPYADTADVLSDTLPHDVQVVGRRGLEDAVAEIAGVVEQRITDESVDRKPIYLIVQGLQRSRDLRRSETTFAFGSEEEKEPEPAQLFETILQNGPEVGVHSLVWCDTYGNLMRVIERRTIEEFGLRVALPMSAEDSNNLLDDSAAAKLDHPNRAFLYDEDRIGSLEKFRPYEVPSINLMNRVQSVLSKRLGR